MSVAEQKKLHASGLCFFHISHKNTEDFDRS